MSSKSSSKKGSVAPVDAARHATPPAVWTVGYNQRPVPEVAELLRLAAVDVVVDVRRYPNDSYPFKNPELLAREFRDAGLKYDWRGEELGRRKAGSLAERRLAYEEYMQTPIFRRALSRLVRQAQRGARVALVCTELSFWQCHRNLIANALSRRGVRVIHLIPHDLAESPTDHIDDSPADTVDEADALTGDEFR